MERAKYPLVTAFTLVYNSGEYAIKSIECIRLNKYPNIEHIIIDDFSTDEISVKIIEDYISKNNYKCTYIKHDKNLGICKTLNEILQLSNGKYIFGLSDDIITENKIIDDIEQFEKLSEDYAVIHSMLQYMNYNGSILYPYILPQVDYPNNIKDDLSINDLLKHGGLVATPTAMIRRDSIIKIGGWNENLMYEDTPLWFAFADKNLKFKFRPFITTYYRRTANQITNVVTSDRNGALINHVKVYGPYLNYRRANFNLFIIFLMAVKKRNKELNTALNIYKTYPFAKKRLYYFFKIIPLFSFLISFFLNLKKKIKNYIFNEE